MSTLSHRRETFILLSWLVSRVVPLHELRTILRTIFYHFPGLGTNLWLLQKFILNFFLTLKPFLLQFLLLNSVLFIHSLARPLRNCWWAFSLRNQRRMLIFFDLFLSSFICSFRCYIVSQLQWSGRVDKMLRLVKSALLCNKRAALSLLRRHQKRHSWLPLSRDCRWRLKSKFK